MAHNVMMRSFQSALKKKVRFVVRDKDNRMVGKLDVCKEKLVWIPKNAKNGIEIKWEEFNQIMNDFES